MRVKETQAWGAVWWAGFGHFWPKLAPFLKNISYSKQVLLFRAPMGRKYRELKAALKANPVRSLLVVDDWGLRLQQFSEAEALLKKIDKADRDQEQFATQDQRLFNDWYELTFRKEKQELEDRRQEYIDLARFHNDLISIVEMEDLSIHEAYWFWQDEEAAYQKGTDQERKTIEERRQQRREFAQKAMEEEFEYSWDGEERWDEDWDGDDDEPEDLPRNEPDLSSLTKSETKTYHFLKSSSPEQLQKYFSQQEDSELLAFEAMGISSKADDQLLFLNVWKALPRKIQQVLSKDFKRTTGQRLEDVMQNLEFLNDLQASMEDSFNEELDEENWNGDFYQIPQRKAATLSALEEESLKNTYRKLARVIHPDSHDPNLNKQLKNWYNKMWLRVQEAYQGKDLLLLQRLETLTTLRLKKLNSLTMDEIKASTQWLEDELSAMQRVLKDLKKHPAWGFSRKRSYDSLITKIRKDFAESLAPILGDIQELKFLHKNLQKPLRKTRRSSPKKSSRGKPRKPKSKPKSKPKDDRSQMSFFD